MVHDPLGKKSDAALERFVRRLETVAYLGHFIFILTAIRQGSDYALTIRRSIG